MLVIRPYDGERPVQTRYPATTDVQERLTNTGMTRTCSVGFVDIDAHDVLPRTRSRQHAVAHAHKTDVRDACRSGRRSREGPAAEFTESGSSAVS